MNPLPEAFNRVTCATLKTQGTIDVPIVLKDDDTYQAPPNALYATFISNRYQQSVAETPLSNIECLLMKEFILRMRGQLGFGEPL
jgi:hypothetical protein